MPKAKTNMVRVNFYVTERQNEMVSRLAERRGVTYSEMMRTLLDKAIGGQRLPRVERKSRAGE